MKRAAAILICLLLCFSAADAEWSKQPSGTLAWLRDIYFANNERGWIVGSDGTILSTDDAGEHWKAPKKFTTDTILRIRFTDANTAWMLCERNVFSRGRSAMSYLRRSTDSGITWETVEFTGAGRERVTTLMFSPDGRGTAFGEGGIFYELQPDGITWKKSVSVVRHLLLSGAMADDSGAIVGGGGTALFTRDQGITWEDAFVAGTKPSRLNSVFFTNPKLAWAVGSGGSLYTSVSGGRTWFARASGTDRELTDVYFSNSREGWAVGADGTIIHTTNGGADWQAERSGVTHRLERIVRNGGRSWIVGFGGTILRDRDGSDDAARPLLAKPR